MYIFIPEIWASKYQYSSYSYSRATFTCIVTIVSCKILVGAIKSVSDDAKNDDEKNVLDSLSKQIVLHLHV